MAHTCQAFVYSCIDFRFHKAVMQWAEEKFGPRNFDYKTDAGSILALAHEDEAVKEFILKQIELAVNGHQVKTIILIQHQTCGGYAARFGQMNMPTEADKQKKDLDTVKELVKGRLPDVDVQGYLATIDESQDPPAIPIPK